MANDTSYESFLFRSRRCSFERREDLGTVVPSCVSASLLSFVVAALLTYAIDAFASRRR